MTLTKQKETIVKDGNTTNITTYNKIVPPKEKKPKGIARVITNISKYKLQNRKVLRDSNQVTIDESEPVYTKDRSRFFKTAWEEEKKQLYFK